MHRKRAFLAAVLLLTLFMTSCSSQTPTAVIEPTATTVPTKPPEVETALAPTTPPETATSASSVNSSVSFSVDVLPILQSRCSSCHGGRRTEEGLNLLSYAAVMAGSEHGAVVIPGDAVNSKLATLVATGKMPKQGPKLTPAQVQMIVDWINAGALNN
jgi:uncharacterized membrane protein